LLRAQLLDRTDGEDLGELLEERERVRIDGRRRHGAVSRLCAASL
jgi:hypothetical protein